MLDWRGFILVVVVCLEETLAALNGRCGVCLSNSVACFDEVSFATCKNGIITNNFVNCPDGTVCTEERTICVSRSTGFSPVCYESNCNTCEPSNGNFACLNETNYAFCYDGVNPDASSARSCPDGRVCSLVSTTICVKASDGGTASCIPDGDDTQATEATIDTTTGSSTQNAEESTSQNSEVQTESTAESSNTDTTAAIGTSTEITTVTISETTAEVETDSEATTVSFPPTDRPTTSVSPIDPNVFCSDKGQKGYFKDPNDITCKTYIYCYILSGQYLGERYYCRGYFNPEQLRCQTTPPSGC